MRSLSIRWQMTLAMLWLGIGLLIIIVASTYYFESMARQSWVKSLSGELERSAEKIRQDMTELGSRAATGSKKTPGFNQAFQNLKANPDSASARDELRKILRESFNQRVISTGEVAVLGFRAYNEDLELLAQQLAEDAPSLPARMVPQFHEKAAAREGSERLKPVAYFGVTDGTAHHSVLAPVGGLGVIGYLEVLVAPVHNLESLEAITGLPIAIQGVDGTELYRSEHWTPEDKAGNQLLASEFTLRSDSGQPALVLKAQKDISGLADHFARAQAYILGIAVLLTAVGLLQVLWFTTRYVTKPLRDTSEQLAAAQEALDVTERFQGEDRSNEVGRLRRGWDGFVGTLGGILRSSRGELDIIRGLSETTSQRLGKVHSSAEDTNGTVNEVVNSTQEVNEVVQNVAENVQEVSQYASDSTGKAQEGMESLTNAYRKLEGLQTANQRVTEIMESIQGIAKKTDLLALNAAIEAANAGEAGKGFAVVADEVRKLAEQTSQATNQVHEIVGELNGETDATVSAMGEAQNKMGEIQAIIQKTDGTANQIAASTEELAATMADTTDTVQGILTNTATVTNAVAEVELATQQLHDSAEAMKERFALFRLTEAEPALAGKTHQLLEAKLAHIDYRTRLIGLLQGHEQLGEDQIASHEECGLGQWLYSEGQEAFGHLHATQELEQVHRDMHSKIIEVVRYHNSGDEHAAGQAYQEFTELAQKVIDRIDQIAEQAS